MAGVTKPQILQARQMSLVEYLQCTDPNELIARRHDYTTRTHDSLIISAETSFDKMVWNWSSRGIGGKGAMDYLMKVHDYPFVDAVRAICDGTHIAHDTPIQNPVKTKERVPFALPIATATPTAAVAYLRQRGIHPDVLQNCLDLGIVYEESKHHNVVFVGKDAQGIAKFAAHRSTHGTFRFDVESSEKKFGFCIPADNPSSNVVSVFEAPIDAMSQATLRRMHPSVCASWNDRHFLALGGTADIALMQFLKDHPQVDTIYIATDNDVAGHKSADTIMEHIKNDPARSQQVKRMQRHVPTVGKDWNDVLLHHLEQMREKQRSKPKLSQER